MTNVVIALAVWATLLTLCCLALSVKCRPKEEKPQEPHPCELCLRWFECNGVDDECPLRKEDADGQDRAEKL